MSLEVIGRVIQLGQRQSGEGRNGTWVRQDLIIETEDQYPKKICLSCWGDRVDEAAAFAVGERIKAVVNIESREFNGKWYTDVKPWRFERMDAGVPTETEIPPYIDSAASEDSYDDDLPF